MRFIISTNPVDIESSHVSLGQFTSKNCNGLSLYFEGTYKIVENDDYLACFSGYISDFSFSKDQIKEQHNSAITQIANTWPVPEHISGSFSLTIIHKADSLVTMCNDLIGIYPLYYYYDNGNLIVSSSILLMAYATSSGFDEVGLAQRSLGKQFANVGSRTILEGVSRLLPGEWLRFDLRKGTCTQKFDNTLFNLRNGGLQRTKSDSNLFWDLYKKETNYAIGKYNNTYMALSGGLDSRLLLGAIDENQEVNCITYGDSNNYEVKLAKRLAKLLGHPFQNYSNLDIYFPEKKIINEYTMATEALSVASWLEILEQVDVNKGSCLLIGDLCEALPARNIKSLSTRGARLKYFISKTVFGYNFKLTPLTEELFLNWVNDKIDSHLELYSENRLSKLNLNISHSKLVEGLISDIKQLINRIKSHDLPYLELCDELFAWYTHSRISMGKQILICEMKFHAISPPMSVAVMRKISQIHPNERLNYRFMRALFKSNKRLKKLAQVPTSQSPLIPNNFPYILVSLVWGLRSKIDNYLISRLIKKKNPNLRYRLFNSINWVRVYQNDRLEERLEDYFSPNYIGKQWAATYKQMIIKRKKLIKWPLFNSDILALTALNTEMDIIKTLKNKVRF